MEKDNRVVWVVGVVIGMMAGMVLGSYLTSLRQSERIDPEKPVTIVHEGGHVTTYTPHCATVENERLFSREIPDRPITLIRYEEGRVQVGYTVTK